VAYDRRGFGQSDKPSTGYDYDTFAEDLEGLLAVLDLNDVTLIGFSMGGGEVARYIAKYGEARLHSVVFASSVTPFMMKSDDNPDGPLDETRATKLMKDLTDDSSAFFDDFTKQFFSPNGDGNIKVSEDVRLSAVEAAKQADPAAALASMKAFAMTDFRDDLTKITIPTLVIHGDADAIVPFEGSGRLTHAIINHSELHIVANGVHGINASHTDEFNSALIEFLAK
jgi:pimeloyl-ACP methyl ester carboxylesterase